MHKNRIIVLLANQEYADSDAIRTEAGKIFEQYKKLRPSARWCDTVVNVLSEDGDGIERVREKAKQAGAGTVLVQSLAVLGAEFPLIVMGMTWLIDDWGLQVCSIDEPGCSDPVFCRKFLNALAPLVCRFYPGRIEELAY